MHLVNHLKQALTALHASWVMWLLLLLSVVSVVLTIERLLFFRAVRDDVPRLARELDELLRATRYGDAIRTFQKSKSTEAKVVVAGLLHADMGPVAAQQAMEGALALEKLRLERGLTFLGTLGNNAPFIGLLGTVIGVIEAFEVLGATDALRASGSSSAIMTGISEALVATALGLFVAIPAVVAFNYFQRRIESIVATTEALSKVLLAHLNAEEAPNPPRVEDSAGAIAGSR